MSAEHCAVSAPIDWGKTDHCSHCTW